MSIAIKEVTVLLDEEQLSKYSQLQNKMSAMAWQIMLINVQRANPDEKLLCHIHLVVMN